MVDGALHDIVQPAAPLAAAAAGPVWPWLLAAAALLAALALWGWRLRNGPGRRRLRRLDRLLAAFRAGTLDGRAAAYLVALELRRVRGTGRLLPERPPPGPEPAAGWAALVGRLDTLRYRPPVPSAAEVERLFADARTWLGCRR